MRDDPRLLARARRGDRRAAGEIFDRHFDAVYRFCRSFKGVSHDEAMDLAQSTLIRAFEPEVAFREDGELGPWLRGIARNALLTERRRSARRAALLAEHGETLRPAGDESRRERIALVRSLVAELDDGPMKEVASRFYSDEEPTIEELADRLGLPRGTVSARLSRFRKLLKSRMLHRVLELRT